VLALHTFSLVLNPLGEGAFSRIIFGIGNESADTTGAMLVPWVAISNTKIKSYFSNKIHGSNFIKQHSETVIV